VEDAEQELTLTPMTYKELTLVAVSIKNIGKSDNALQTGLSHVLKYENQ
jgi:hypothetical protein